jgi:hypothetical protein
MYVSDNVLWRWLSIYLPNYPTNINTTWTIDLMSFFWNIPGTWLLNVWCPESLNQYDMSEPFYGVFEIWIAIWIGVCTWPFWAIIWRRIRSGFSYFTCMCEMSRMTQKVVSIGKMVQYCILYIRKATQKIEYSMVLIYPNTTFLTKLLPS